MNFNKNYNNHEFVILTHIGPTYKCTKCNIKMQYLKHKRKKYSFNINAFDINTKFRNFEQFNAFTCEEVIIKGLLE